MQVSIKERKTLRIWYLKNLYHSSILLKLLVVVLFVFLRLTSWTLRELALRNRLRLAAVPRNCILHSRQIRRCPYKTQQQKMWCAKLWNCPDQVCSWPHRLTGHLPSANRHAKWKEGHERKMEFHSRPHHNGILRAMELQLNPLRNGIAMGAYVEWDRNGILSTAGSQGNRLQSQKHPLDHAVPMLHHVYVILIGAFVMKFMDIFL